MTESLRKNERILLEIGSTIADGLAVPMVGANTFHNSKGVVDKMVSLSIQLFNVPAHLLDISLQNELFLNILLTF